MAVKSSWVEYQTMDVDIEVGSFKVEIKKIIVRDNDYGSDRDGNRGVRRYSIDEWEIENILNVETGKDVTEEFKNNIELHCEVEAQLELN